MNAKELRALRRDYRRLYDACSKIMDLYAKAPGSTNPEPTTKLVWSMYQAALKARASAQAPQ